MGGGGGRVFTEYTFVGGEGERLTGSSVLKEVWPV